MTQMMNTNEKLPLEYPLREMLRIYVKRLVLFFIVVALNFVGLLAVRFPVILILLIITILLGLLIILQRSIGGQSRITTLPTFQWVNISRALLLFFGIVLYLVWRFSEPFAFPQSAAVITSSAPTITPISTKRPILITTDTPVSPPTQTLPSLTFVNESDFDLQVFIAELDKIIPVFKDSISRILVVPGEYDYKVAWAGEGAPVLADTVTVSAGESVTITVTAKNVSALAFKNESGLEITVNLPDLGESFRVAPRSTTEGRPLPPGDYTYTVEAVGSPGAVLTDTADLNPNQVTVVTIKAEAITTSDLVVQNDTDFELSLTLNGNIIKPIVVPPQQSSQPQPLLPGEYSYEVSVGGANNTGQVSITPNETKVLAFDLKTVIPDVGGLRFVNQTGSTISININGVAGAITVAPNETSPEKELPPGTYQYTVKASNFAPYSSEATVEKGYAQEVTIVLGGTRTEVKVINKTGCDLTISFSGPDSLSVTIPTGQSETINLQEGNYSYSVQACSAFASYNEYFSGGSEIEFSLH